MREVLEGRVVPLFGAGANLCDRPAGTTWEHGHTLPSGAELSTHLAARFDYPDDDLTELVRVSEYAYVMTGSGPLYDQLHEVFDADYAIGPLHRFLATLPARLRLAGLPRVCPLVLTTNYDDATRAGVRRRAGSRSTSSPTWPKGEHRGRFVHWAPDAEPVVVERPNEYRALRPGERTVILKMHGAVDRSNPDATWDSYVITEDHYIEYLARTDIANLVPVTLAAKLRRSHFLFLGYSMRDWNLRVILHRIWGEQKLKYKSWAIQLRPSELDREFWELRGVDVLDVPLDDYVAALDAALDALLADRVDT